MKKLSLVTTMALAGVAQNRPEGRDPIGHTEDIHVDDPAPIRRRRIEHGSGRSDPRIIHHDVYSAEVGERPLGELGHGIGIEPDHH